MNKFTTAIKSAANKTTNFVKAHPKKLSAVGVLMAAAVATAVVKSKRQSDATANATPA
jgi:hypothetical protein